MMTNCKGMNAMLVESEKGNETINLKDKEYTLVMELLNKIINDDSIGV